MKGMLWKKALAAAAALLIVSGGTPIKPVSDLFGGMAITASAEEEDSGKCGDDATWSLDDAGKLTISGTGAMDDYEYTEYGGVVNSPWHNYADKITSVEIQNGVTSIGNSAFDGCAALTSVMISDSVESIGDYAFSDCSKLTSITIPDRVTSIGENAFDSCTGLTSIEIPDSVISIGNYAFYNCSKLTSITIPDSVECIGDYAFSDCSKLTSITIPDRVTSIGENAFDSCTGLTSIEIPDSVISIGNSAFSDCTSLTSIKIPDGVTSIGNYVFCNCSKLTSITIPNSVISIGQRAFSDCTSLTSVKMSQNVTSIGENAFDSCTDLTSITIPKNVISIGNDAFRYCTGITDVYCYANPANLTWDENDCDDFKEDRSTVCHVPKEYLDTYTSEKFSDVNVTFKAEAMDKCGDNAFWSFDSETGKLTISGTGEMYDYEYNEVGGVVNSPWYNYADKITSVEIQNGVTSIGNGAFEECAALTSVTISDSVTSIGEFAFTNCESLTSITIPASVTSIVENAFYLCQNIRDVYCYANPANLTWNDGECDDFIQKPKHTTVCYVPERYLANYNTKFGAGSDDPVNVTFKAEATDKCGDHATWLFDPDTHKLTISGTGEMYDYDDDPKPWNDYSDNITSVEIKNGVTSIGNSAFAYCKGLTSITIPDSVESIGADAFSSCESLTSITIPDSVESIGADAFYNCTSLTSITIPDSVESIDADAFYGCTGITDVYCYADPSKLTWDEGVCYDFKEDGSTVCHVPERYLADYNTKFGAGSDYPVNVTFVGDLIGFSERLEGYSVSLDGTIGVSFYMTLDESILGNYDAMMVFTLPNGEETGVYVRDVKDNPVSVGNKTYYVFRCDVAAKEMTKEIKAQLKDGNSPNSKAGEVYTFTVKEYADYLLSHTNVAAYAKAAPLVKAMLNYGAYAQTYFNYEAGNLANDGLSEKEKAVDSVAVPVDFKYNDVNTKLPAGVTFAGATLSLKSETTLSLYFTGLPDNTTFACGDKEVKTEKNGSYVVARIRGIKAEELKNNFTLTFNGGSNSVTYNPMTYCYNVLNGGSDNVKLQNVVKALYKYAEAAKPNS